MLKLKSFLNCNDSIVSVKESSRVFIKVEHPSKEIIYVLEEKFSNSGEFNPLNMNAVFFGIYVIKSNTFIFETELDVKYCNVDLSELNVSTLSEIKEEIESKVNDLLAYKVNKNKERVHVELKKYEVITDEAMKSIAERKFINGVKIFNGYSASYSINNLKYRIDLLVDYLINSEITIDKEVEEYIENNKKDIYREIELNERIIKYLDSIKEDTYIQNLQRMATVFNDENIKSLNIHYKEDEKEMKFKISNSVLLEDRNDTISISNIINADEFKQFKELFSKEDYYTSINPRCIEKITYGKKILFEKK